MRPIAQPQHIKDVGIAFCKSLVSVECDIVIIIFMSGAMLSLHPVSRSDNTGGNFLRFLGGFGRTGLRMHLLLGFVGSSDGFSPSIDPSRRHGFYMFLKICSVIERCFCFVALTGHFGVLSHFMSIKETLELLVAPFEHAQNLLMRPRIHVNGPNKRSSDTIRAMLSTALQTQECSVTDRGPLWIKGIAINAPSCPRKRIQETSTGWRKIHAFFSHRQLPQLLQFLCRQSKSGR